MFSLLLVLDIDGTLVHNTIDRPHARKFIQWTLDNFQHVAIWTMASMDWAREVVTRLGFKESDFLFIYDGDRGTPKIIEGNLEYRKSLRKIWQQQGMRAKGITKMNTLIIDDLVEVCKDNLGNMIRIPSFEGDPSDKALVKVMEFFTNNEHPTDVRLWNEKHSIFTSQKQTTPLF